MNPVNISQRRLGDVVWRHLLESAAFRQHCRQPEVLAALSALESLRSVADYNTGSISASSAWLLYAATSYFQPQTILEVGTFIGKSTLAMALGAQDGGRPCEVHTCDLSNDITLPDITRSSIVQYPKTSSTDMFGRLLAQQKSGFEFVHLDGRLQNDDFPLFARLVSTQAVIALDDFEGLEKGVVNLANLTAAGLMGGFHVAYPPERALLTEFGLHDRCVTALLIPRTLVQFTAQ